MSGPDDSFLATILTPGSSLHPRFLAIVDAVFAILLLVLLTSAYLSGSYHFVVLIAIQLCLWASVKWFVNELKNTPVTVVVTEGEESSGERSKSS